MPRPQLDVESLVPDFHEELRWPMSAMSHPELAPQFEIAAVFAQPGIGFIELCERGVQNRITAGRNRDELEYLRGCCSAVKGDADAACGKLAPLANSPVLGLQAAIRTDLANIIANHGDVDEAERLLAKHRLDDGLLLDTLAATYLEVDKPHAAYEMNRRALDSSGHTTNATHCRRLVRDIVLRNDRELSPRVKELAGMVTNHKLPDPVCVSLHRALKCWQKPGMDCLDYFQEQKIDHKNLYLLVAYRAWPTTGDYFKWVGVAADALSAHPLAGSEDLAVVALDASLRADAGCDSYQRIQINKALELFAPAGKPRIEALMATCKSRLLTTNAAAPTE